MGADLSQEAVEVAAGIGLTEGPLWTSDGRLLVTTFSRGLVWEVSLDAGPARVAFDPGGTPSGLAEDGAGDIWVTQAQGPHKPTPGEPPSMQRWDHQTGRVSRVTGPGLDAPNDVCVGPDGRIWFTDPAGDPFDPDAPPGRVMALEPGDGTAAVLRGGLKFPNGLAVNAQGDRLFVAETAARRVVVMAWDGQSLGAPELFTILPVGSPDGMALDADGYLHVAVPDADRIVVFDPEGGLAEQIELGRSFPTNCAFVGPDLDRLAVTAAKGGRVLLLGRPRPGLPLDPGPNRRMP